MIRIYAKDKDVILSYKEGETVLKETETEKEAEEYLDSLHKRIQGLAVEPKDPKEALQNLKALLDNEPPSKEKKLAEILLKSVSGMERKG